MNSEARKPEIFLISRLLNQSAEAPIKVGAQDAIDFADGTVKP
jgi:hypothetical protein